MSYQYIIVESFFEQGAVHIRPIKGQEPFLKSMKVECSDSLKDDYPAGTRFEINAKLISREGGPLFVYSHYSWAYTVLEG